MEQPGASAKNDTFPLMRSPCSLLGSADLIFFAIAKKQDQFSVVYSPWTSVDIRGPPWTVEGQSRAVTIQRCGTWVPLTQG